MVYSLLITFREGLEVALILGILFAYLARLGQPRSGRFLLAGAATALVVSLVAGGVLHGIGERLYGASLEVFEGAMMLLATVLLTYMVLWMQRHARHLKREIHGRLEARLHAGSEVGLAVLAFVLVAREGFETVVFLLAGAGRWSPVPYGAGILGGLLAAALVGYGLYRGSVRLDLRRFFTITGWMLLLFAAGMVANGFKELHEAGVLPRLVPHVWDTYELLPDSTPLGRVLGALVGYDASPSLLQVLGSWAYLLLAGSWFWRGSRPAALAFATPARET